MAKETPIEFTDRVLEFGQHEAEVIYRDALSKGYSREDAIAFGREVKQHRLNRPRELKPLSYKPSQKAIREDNRRARQNATMPNPEWHRSLWKLRAGDARRYVILIREPLYPSDDYKEKQRRGELLHKGRKVAIYDSLPAAMRGITRRVWAADRTKVIPITIKEAFTCYDEKLKRIDPAQVDKYRLYKQSRS